MGIRRFGHRISISLPKAARALPAPTQTRHYAWLHGLRLQRVATFIRSVAGTTRLPGADSRKAGRTDCRRPVTARCPSASCIIAATTIRSASRNVSCRCILPRASAICRAAFVPDLPVRTQGRKLAEQVGPGETSYTRYDRDITAARGRLAERGRGQARREALGSLCFDDLPAFSLKCAAGILRSLRSGDRRTARTGRLGCDRRPSVVESLPRQHRLRSLFRRR